MSEADRQHRLRIENRLEELRRKHGHEDTWPELRDGPPAWVMPEALEAALWQERQRRAMEAGRFDERLLKHHRQMLSQERANRPDAARAAQEAQGATEPENTAEEASAPRRVLSLADVRQAPLDRYGETAIFGCPVCGEESAKGSSALRIWHCTACDATRGFIHQEQQRGRRW